MRQVGFVSPFQMTGEFAALDRSIRQVQHGNKGGSSVGLQAAAELEAAHIGQVEIKDDDVRDFRSKAKPFSAVRCVSDFEACFSEWLVESVPPTFVGNDDQRRKW